MRSILMSLPVCLSAPISRKLHSRTSPNFLCMWNVAVARSFFADAAICYVLPVLWMTLFSHNGYIWRDVPIPKRREHNSLNYCIHSKQILLSDKDQQLQYTSWVVHRGDICCAGLFCCVADIQTSGCRKSSVYRFICRSESRLLLV